MTSHLERAQLATKNIEDPLKTITTLHATKLRLQNKTKKQATRGNNGIANKKKAGR